MIHGLSLVAISAHPRLGQKKVAAGALALGSALFSGSIYTMVLMKMKGSDRAKILGPVTPLGGIVLLNEWADDRPFDDCGVGGVDFLVIQLFSRAFIEWHQEWNGKRMGNALGIIGIRTTRVLRKT